MRSLPLHNLEKSRLPAYSGLFGMALMLVLVFTQGAKLLVDGDTYTHIYLGTWMIENLALPSTDFLSHTVSGTPWVIHEWGAEVLMGLVYNFSGLAGVSIFFALLVGLTFTLLFLLLENLDTDPWLALPMMVVTLLLLYPMILARPHIFSWLLGSLTFLILHSNRRWLWSMPIIMILWVNLHGGFILGLVLQGIFIVGGILDNRNDKGWRVAIQKQRQAITILILCLVVTGLNPHGYNILGFYLEVRALDVTQYNPEWQSPDLQTFWILRAYLALLMFGLLVRREPVRWTHLLLLVFCLEAALCHRRHVSLIAILMLPLWLDILRPIQKRLAAFLNRCRHPEKKIYSGWTGPATILMIACILVVAVHAIQPGKQDQLQKLFPVSKRFPQGAWAYIAEHQPDGRVFNEYSWGASLIYWSWGELPVFIDGFAHKYGEQIYKDYYTITGLEENAEELLDSYQVDWVLFPTSRPLIRYLLLTGNWQQIYRDEQASILKRVSTQGAVISTQ
jgi:hypothetical protein